jgi:hypothetical protein
MLDLVLANQCLTDVQFDVLSVNASSRYNALKSAFLIGDSGQMPGNRCTICITSGLDCTHAEITKVRMACRILLNLTHDLMKTLGSAKGYVTALSFFFPIHSYFLRYVESLGV